MSEGTLEFYPLEEFFEKDEGNIEIEMLRDVKQHLFRSALAGANPSFHIFISKKDMLELIQYCIDNDTMYQLTEKGMVLLKQRLTNYITSNVFVRIQKGS